MPMGRFLLWTTFGSLIWNGLLTYAGIVLGSQWENVLGLVDRYEKVALGIIAVGLIWFVVNRVLKVRRNRAESKQV